MKKNRLFLLLTALAVVSLLPAPVAGKPAAAIAVSSPALSREITVNQVDNETMLPAVAYDSVHNEYLVVWHTKWGVGTRDVRAQRVSASGALLGGEILVYEHATKDAFQPSVAYDPVNDRFLVTFIFDSSGSLTDTDLYGRFVTWNGATPSAAFPIVTYTSGQWNPQVVYAGGIQQEFFVVWTNTPASLPTYISGKRIRPDGTFPSTGSDLTQADGAYVVNYIDPDVSYNLARNEYLGSGTRSKATLAPGMTSGGCASPPAARNWAAAPSPLQAGRPRRRSRRWRPATSQINIWSPGSQTRTRAARIMPSTGT